MNNTKNRAARVAAGLPAGLSTGNSVVDRIGQMHFEGNILDHRWLSAPKMRYESGKLNINAVLVLVDVIYWHRPTSVRHESSGRIIEIRKKFSGSEFWKDYATWAEGLGLTKRQLQDAVSFLVAAGLIEREIRPVYVEGVQTNNLLILTPNPDAIAARAARARHIAHRVEHQAQIMATLRHILLQQTQIRLHEVPFFIAYIRWITLVLHTSWSTHSSP